MKTVQAIQTVDGKLFLDEETASEHERGVTLRREVYGFWDRHGCYDMDGRMAAQTMLEHWAEIVKIAKSC